MDNIHCLIQFFNLHRLDLFQMLGSLWDTLEQYISCSRDLVKVDYIANCTEYDLDIQALCL